MTTPFAKAMSEILSPPPKPDDTPYYTAIGRFVVEYAFAEGLVHIVARKLTGLKDAKARILFGGSRLGDVMSRARQLLREKKVSQKTYANIDACFTQLDVIGLQRDKIVHRFVNYDAMGMLVSNHLTTKSLAQVESEIITLQELDSLINDCITICIRLAHFRYPKRKKNISRDFRKHLYGPWRYKPPKPKIQTKQPPPSPQLLKPPPHASEL